MSVCSASTSSEELGSRIQTPTLIGCIFLRITTISSYCLFVLLRCDQRSLRLLHGFCRTVKLFSAFFSCRLASSLSANQQHNPNPPQSLEFYTDFHQLVKNVFAKHPDPESKTSSPPNNPTPRRCGRQQRSPRL